MVRPRAPLLGCSFSAVLRSGLLGSLNNGVLAFLVASSSAPDEIIRFTLGGFSHPGWLHGVLVLGWEVLGATTRPIPGLWMELDMLVFAATETFALVLSSTMKELLSAEVIGSLGRTLLARPSEVALRLAGVDTGILLSTMKFSPPGVPWPRSMLVLSEVLVAGECGGPCSSTAKTETLCMFSVDEE